MLSMLSALTGSPRAVDAHLSVERVRPLDVVCHNRHSRTVESKPIKPIKPLVWVATSWEDLKGFPDEVRRSMGYALYLAQAGKKHLDAKPLKGFGGAGVLEVVEDFDGNAYRAVYTVKLASVVYALHAFQKKSKKGIKTSSADIDKVKARLKLAVEIHAQQQAEQKENADEKH